jgi:D-alanyl-lipoteichoic acid acyltransferase DltB (MBOAT superfamily)
MYFNSMQYALFFLIVLIVNYVLPQKVRYLWLLAASYYFYMSWNAKYALLMLGVSLITYISALLINHLDKREFPKAKKGVLAASLVLCFGLLIYFKYLNFLLTNINGFLDRFSERSIQLLDILLPVGISFYIFQAVGYVIDVYRSEIESERNPFRYALFVSYFPQLVAGPIERSKNLLGQLRNPVKLSGDRLREGLIYILIGLWQKVAIADVISGLIVPIFNNYHNYNGSVIAIATMLFGIQIYCDFSGYTNIAIGCAKILGVDLMSNFNAPYLATSVPDFWKRWHISLTSWFRDYLYIPLGGNRKGEFRKYLNTLIVFLVSGAWHGAAWNYIVWGLLNGMMIVLSNVSMKYRKQSNTISRVDIMGKRVITFLCVGFAWLFFRAPNLRTAIDIIKFSITHPGIRYFLKGGVLNCFGSIQIIVMLLLSIVILFLIDSIREKKGNFIAYFSEQKAIYRWSFYIILFLIIVIYGAYGEGYEQTEFIYFQF